MLVCGKMYMLNGGVCGFNVAIWSTICFNNAFLRLDNRPITYFITMKIIPNPQKIVKFSGEFVIENNDTLYCDEALLPVAKLFAQLVESSNGTQLQLVDDMQCAKIILSVDCDLQENAYVLMINQGDLAIGAGGEEGCFYALQTLRQLLDLDGHHEVLSCANCYVEDQPKFAYRGLHVDICRHFFGLETLKTIADLMSRVKLNKLHLHLSDDQGFRVQIDKYPLLNTVASTRTGSEVVKNGKRFVDDVEVSGYLTKADITQLVDYCKQLHIDIIPEIDMPGHFVAALCAYPQFSCTGEVTSVRKKWGISKDILCAGNDEALQFAKDIVTEVAHIFPYELFHLGGDEAPKDRWCNCKLCKEKLSALRLNSFDELQGWFVDQVRLHLQTLGKQVICWNDGIYPNTDSQVISQHWLGFKRKAMTKAINRGRKTIVSPNFHMYLDYPYALTSLRKVRALKPLKGVKRTAQHNVLGVEATLWTEYIPTEDRLFFNLCPRIDAVSEVAWGSAKRGFVARVKHHNRVYQQLGITYNKRATKRQIFGRLLTVRKWWKKDSNVELNRNK